LLCLQPFPTRRSSDLLRLVSDKGDNIVATGFEGATGSALTIAGVQADGNVGAAVSATGDHGAVVTGTLNINSSSGYVIAGNPLRSEEHTSELQSRENL